MQTMSFNDAMAAHIVWKLRLTRFIDGVGDEVFDSAAVARDDLCDLGKWIYGEGSKYRTMPAYEGLMNKHAEFHRHAAEVLRIMQDGDKQGAMRIMKGPFEAASRGIISAMVDVRRQASSE